VKLIERAVGDIERGVVPEDRGWMSFDTEISNGLLQTGLCEREEKSGKVRIVSSVEIPNDLAELGPSRVLKDVRMAETVGQELTQMWRQKKTCEPVLQGLRGMLSSGIRTVSPERLQEAELCSWEWFSMAHTAIGSLVMTAAEKMWSHDSTRMEVAKRHCGEKVPAAQIVEKTLRWKEVVDGLGKDGLEALGFMWFADGRLQSVENPIGKRIAQRVLIKSIGLGSFNMIEEVVTKAEADYVNYPWW
jgi:hypothetical protein